MQYWEMHFPRHVSIIRRIVAELLLLVFPTLFLPLSTILSYLSESDSRESIGKKIRKFRRIVGKVCLRMRYTHRRDFVWNFVNEGCSRIQYRNDRRNILLCRKLHEMILYIYTNFMYNVIILFRVQFSCIVKYFNNMCRNYVFFIFMCHLFENF